jgi:hypothetical protein
MTPMRNKLELSLFLQFTLAASGFLLFISLLEMGLSPKTQYKISSDVQNQVVLPIAK